MNKTMKKNINFLNFRNNQLRIKPIFYNLILIILLNFTNINLSAQNRELKKLPKYILEQNIIKIHESIEVLKQDDRLANNSIITIADVYLKIIESDRYLKNNDKYNQAIVDIYKQCIGEIVKLDTSAPLNPNEIVFFKDNEGKNSNVRELTKYFQDYFYNYIKQSPYKTNIDFYLKTFKTTDSKFFYVFNLRGGKLYEEINQEFLKSNFINVQRLCLDYKRDYINGEYINQVIQISNESEIKLLLNTESTDAILNIKKILIENPNSKYKGVLLDRIKYLEYLKFRNARHEKVNELINKSLIEKWIADNKPLFFQNFSLVERIESDEKNILNKISVYNSIQFDQSNGRDVKLTCNLVYIDKINFINNDGSFVIKAKKPYNNSEFVYYDINLTNAFELCEIDTLPCDINELNPKSNLITNLFFNLDFDLKWSSIRNGIRALDSNVNVKMLVNAINSRYKYINTFQKKDYDELIESQLKAIMSKKQIKDSLINYNYTPIIEFSLSQFNIEDNSYNLNYFQESQYFNFYQKNIKAKYLNNTGFYKTNVYLDPEEVFLEEDKKNDITYIQSTSNQNLKIYVDEVLARKIESELNRNSTRNLIAKFNTIRDQSFILNDKNTLSNCLEYKPNNQHFGIGGDDNYKADEYNCDLDYYVSSIDFNINGKSINIPIVAPKEINKIPNALAKINQKWDYFFKEFSDKKYLIKDSIINKCNDERCVMFLLTDNYLIVSYKLKEVTEFDTQIIDFNSNEDILGSVKDHLSLDGYDKEKNILQISTEGYDKKGRFFQTGQWDISNRSLKLNIKSR